MLQIDRETNRDRIKSLIAVAAIHALIGYALIAGLRLDVAAIADERLKIFDVFEEPPPPPAEPPPPDQTKSDKNKTKDPEGAASPANLRDTPSPIVAPPPVIPLDLPSPVIAAPVAGRGNADSAGAADIPGPGTGSGGLGTGLGSGDAGSGTGGGGGGGGEGSPLRWISGSIRDSDYPRSAADAEVGGTVLLRFVVAPTGRVSDCRVTRSSGHPDLDTATCRLIKKRFRYRPTRDARGRAVPDVVTGEHVWTIGPRDDRPSREEPPDDPYEDY